MTDTPSDYMMLENLSLTINEGKLPSLKTMKRNNRRRPGRTCEGKLISTIQRDELACRELALEKMS